MTIKSRSSKTLRGGGRILLLICALSVILVSCRNNTSIPPWMLFPPYNQTTTYTVTFLMSNQESQPSGATLPSAMFVEKDSIIAEPAAPAVEDGWQFIGWSTNSDIYTAFDFTSQITANTNIYAFFASTGEITEDESLPEGTKAEIDEETGGYAIYSSGVESTVQNIVIPSEINGIPVTKIGGYVFSNNKSLQSLTIPEGIKEIGDSAFEGSTLQGELILPSTLEKIGFSCFANTDITAVTFNGGVDTIRSYAFRNAVHLTSVVFAGDGPNTIGSFSFENTGLTSITIPAETEEIRAYAFKDSELSSVQFEESNSKITINADAFQYTSIKEITISRPVILLPWAFEGVAENFTLNLDTDSVEFGTDSSNDNFVSRFGENNTLNFMCIEKPGIVTEPFEHFAVPDGQNWPEDWDIVGSGSESHRFNPLHILWKE